MQNNLKQILKFLQEAEKLKSVIRHSWLSTGHHESVAEHSWRLALMAIVLSPIVDSKIDLTKALQMAIVHDLAEIHAGDHIAWKKKSKNHHTLEKKALTKLLKNLPPIQKKQIQNLWKEYETKKTPEAKFAKAVDKLETLNQHNLADLKTWTKEEYGYNLIHGTEEVKYSKTLQALKDLTDTQTRAKIGKK